MIFTRFLAPLAIMGSLAFSGPAAAGTYLTFGVYTSDGRSQMERQFRPVLRRLEKVLSATLDDEVRIELRVASSYEEGIGDMVAGRVDFGRLGPASYVIAKDRNDGLEILAIESKKGRKTFKGVIAVANNSLVQNVGDLRGKSFAFGDERSTIGRYLAQLYLAQNDIRAMDLSHYDYLGRHDRVGFAVAHGKFDAGALKSSTFKKLVAEGIAIRQIADFENVTKPWVASSSRSGPVKRAIGRALLEMTDGNALRALRKDGFLAGADSDYDVIRLAIRGNEEFFEVSQASN